MTVRGDIRSRSPRAQTGFGGLAPRPSSSTASPAGAADPSTTSGAPATGMPAESNPAHANALESQAGTGTGPMGGSELLAGDPSAPATAGEPEAATNSAPGGARRDFEHLARAGESLIPPSGGLAGKGGSPGETEPDRADNRPQARIRLTPMAATRAKMVPRNIRKVSFATEKPIYQYVMTEACRRGITAKELWWEALCTPIPFDLWTAYFVEPQIRPKLFFMQRHKEAGRQATSVDLPQGIFDKIEEEQKALTDAFKEFGPNKLATVLEARVLLWAFKVSNPEGIPTLG